MASPITQKNTTTQSSSANNAPNDTIRKLKAQLKEAQEQSNRIQQDLDKKCEEYSDLEKKKIDLEIEVETERAENATLSEQKSNGDKVYKGQVDTLKQKADLATLKESMHTVESEIKCNGKEHQEEDPTTPNHIHITAALATLKSLVETNFECSICHDVCADPHVIPECLHRFCGVCIKESIRQCGGNCPLCRARVTTERGLRKDNELKEMMNKVLIAVHHLEEVEDNDDIDIMAETLLTKLEQEKKEYGLLLRQQLETRKKLRNARAENAVLRRQATGP